jgi:hypothetical protein
MKVNITPELVAATYDMLCQTAPFKGWGLPPSDDVRITVMRTREFYADCSRNEKGEYHLRVSQVKQRSLFFLIMTVAHEMVHIREAQTGGNPSHGAAFRKLAMQVCRTHGFDPGAF